MAPYKDPEKQKEAVMNARKKAYITSVTVYIHKDDKILYNRLVKECEKLDIPLATYFREAVREKLGLPPRKSND